jgi:hypothetical protein
MIHSLVVDSEGLATSLRKQVVAAGLNILEDEKDPWYANGFDPSLVGGPFRSNPLHRCEEEPAITLPGILVFDVTVWHAGAGKHMCNESRFRPYWTKEVLVLHQDAPQPDHAEWREMCALEAVCGIAQYPHLGSLRGGNGWSKDFGFGQAYRCPKRNRVVVAPDGTPFHHHRGYVRRDPGDSFVCMWAVYADPSAWDMVP